MPIDSKQKRMSTLNLVEAWRGGQVDAAEAGFTQGNRQASAFEYSGILAAAPVVGGQPTMRRWGGTIWPVTRLGRGW